MNSSSFNLKRFFSSNNIKVGAFTICELLIVMGILGVVAEITLPALVSNVTTTSWVRNMDNFEVILNEATKEMNVNQALTGYTTNTAFLTAFQKYIKVSKACNVSNMPDCFESSFKTASGKVIQTNTLTTGSDIGMKTNTSNLVGAQFINGTNSIIAYDPACAAMDWVSSASGTYSDATSSTRQYTAGPTTSCIAMVYDINGFKGPNTIGKDISLLNAKITTFDGIKVGSMNVAVDISYTPISEAPYATNYWAGARNKCTSLGMSLPTIAQLLDIKASGLIKTGNYWSSVIGTGQYAANNAYHVDMSSGWSGPISRGDPNRKMLCVSN